MWLLYAVGSALFAGLTSILAKCGIRKTDSTVATAIRTIIVLIFAWVMVFVVGSQGTIAGIPARSLVFLGLSGLATGASWLCYFYALQRGPIDKVVPIDKSSTVMTILLAALLLGESVTLTRGIGVVLIAVSLLIIVFTLAQEQKGQGLSAAIMGDNTAMAAGRERGVDAKLAKLTKICGIVFFVVTLVVCVLSARL